MSKALRIAIFYLPIFVGLSLWELAARAGLLNPSLFPSLGDTLTAFGRLATKGHLLDHAELSLFRQSSGFFLAACFGIASGILMAESRRMRNILEPLLRAKVGSFLAPFWWKAQKDGGFRQLFQQKDGMGTTLFLFFCAKEDFIKQHRDVLVKFLADYVHGIAVVHEPKNRERVLKIMAELSNRPASAFAEWTLLPGKDIYHDPHGLVNVKALQSNIDSLAELKMIPKSFDVSKHIDNSLVEDASKGM
jgi:hypothetical protein